MKTSPLRAAVLAAFLPAFAPAHAGRYPAAGTQDFAYPDGTTAFAGATLTSSFLGSFSKVINNTLQLADKASPGNSGAFRVANLDPGSAIESFDATFAVRMEKNGTAQPGTGWSLSFGPLPASGNGAGDLGFPTAGGIVLAFDTYANSANDVPSIEVYCNNASVGNFPATALAETAAVTGGTFRLTNPAATTGTTTTGNISYTASASSMQTSMRMVNGWGGVVVAGAPGAWIVTMGAPGGYDDPVGNGAALTGPRFTPGQGRVEIVNSQDGTASLPEIWNISVAGRGFVFDSVFRMVECHWDYSGLDLTYNGQQVFSDLPTPGFTPASGQTFAFSATAGIGGAGSQDTYFDDLLLATTRASPLETGGPVISEFMAENKNILEDEDMASPDWIEIYNGRNAGINLNGYKLTNGTATWNFPPVSMAAYGHLVVYASGKDRKANPALLHTSFTLPKGGGSVALLDLSDVVVSAWTYPNQIEDVSYGLKYQGGDSGFLSLPGPGVGTQYNDDLAPNGPAEHVVWSRPGAIIVGSTEVSVATPLAPDSVVRYTTDNSKPSAASPVFPPTLTVAASVNLRARVFTPGHLPGPVTSRSFLLIDASLANYNNSGQPFKSHLPLIVLDSFGVNVDAVTNSAGPRPHRYTYGVVIDRDPATGFADITSPNVDFRGRGGTHVRGDSSSGFAQKSYAWETWDNDDNDQDASILGMPAESDWVLHGPYTDKTFFRNLMTFQKMRELHGDGNGRAMRTRLVEVIYNQDANQPLSYGDYRGVYVLMERIKRGNDRVDIARLNSLVTDPALISGGYIFRRDRTSFDGNTPLPVGMHAHAPNLLNAAQTTWLTNHLNAFNNALNGPNFADPVLGYAPYIDVDSFIDNWWFVEIMKQIDGYRLSTYFYKDRGGKIFAAPLWDYNLSLGNADYLAGDQFAGWYWNQTDTYWWARLRQDPNYEIRNWDRYWEMRRGIFDTASILAYIDGLKSEAVNGSATAVTNNMSLPFGQPSTSENAARRHYRKYPVLGTYLWPNAGGAPSAGATLNPRPWQVNTSFQAEVEWMKGWLSQRLNWIDNQNFTGGVIYRPPGFSPAGGSVPAGASLTISRYTGTAPPGFTYATGGTLYFTTDGSDPRVAQGGLAETAFVSGGNDACRWLVPTSANGGFSLTSGPGPNQWTNHPDAPNNASWTAATTGIGYDAAPDYLPLLGANGNTQSLMRNINATCYVRVPFTISSQAVIDGIGTLRLGMKYDDGFRAYINGVAVAGGNDTHASMTTNPWTARATIARDEAAAVTFENFDVTASGVPALRVGTNVLAIHCLNGVDSSSSDLLMVPKLTWFPPSVGGGGGQVYTGPVPLTTSVTVKSRLFANGVWSPVMSGTFVVDADPASAANLVISELHYAPSGPTSAEIAAGFEVGSDFEFVELLNVGPRNVDLGNCRFTDGITYAFGNEDPAYLTLAPGERALVVGNLAAFLIRYGSLPGARILGEFGGNLNNGGETVTLLAANGDVIASFTYGNAEPWPVDAHGAGYSLLLNNPAAASYEDGASWRSSGQVGGSPGAANGVSFTGSPSGDTDHDGMGDFMEHAMGTDWDNPHSVTHPRYSLVTDPDGAPPGTYFVYQFQRNLAADGILLAPQHSADLGGWGSDGILYVGTQNTGDGTALVTYRGTSPLGDPEARTYVRLIATSVP